MSPEYVSTLEIEFPKKLAFFLSQLNVAYIPHSNLFSTTRFHGNILSEIGIRGLGDLRRLELPSRYIEAADIPSLISE